MEHVENSSENRIIYHSKIGTDNDRIRVVIADDNARMLETIVRLLTPHCEIVGTAGHGSAALEMIKRQKPDIAVLDIEMPFKTGIEVAADLQTNGPRIRVVIVSAHDDESYIQAAHSAGALAFISKMRLGDELVPAIKNAFAENESHLTSQPGQ